MTTYEKIKTLRTQNKLSQEELARLAGYTDRSSIAKIEAGKVDLTESKIVTFANIFGVSPSYLMGLIEETAPAPSPALSWDQQELLDNYNQLNEEGQEDLRRHARVMVRSGEYTRRPLDVLDKKA